MRIVDSPDATSHPLAPSVFLFGFAKNERDNVEDDELATLHDIAKSWFAADVRGLANAIAEGLIQEVPYD